MPNHEFLSDPKKDLAQFYCWLERYKKIQEFTVTEWQQFYQAIRDPQWPECDNFAELKNLPAEIQQEIFWTHVPGIIIRNPYNSYHLSVAAGSASAVEKMCESSVVDHYLDRQTFELTHQANCHGIMLKYHPSMECGGLVRTDLFLRVLDTVAPDRQFDHCLEWCSGAGFIGYNILGRGNCKKLDLADIWLPALRAAGSVEPPHTAKTWHIRQLRDIPNGNTYDLIVGNPPWFTGHLMDHVRSTCDPGLQIHQQFFQDVGQYLRPGGVVILCEGQTYVGPKDFRPMLAQHGLEMTQVLVSEDRWHWFAVIQHK